MIIIIISEGGGAEDEEKVDTQKYEKVDIEQRGKEDI
jgi:hypothetical protein